MPKQECKIFIIICSGSVTGMKAAMLIGIYSFIAFQFIVVSFLMLTCVERYLAVVHPSTFFRAWGRKRGTESETLAFAAQSSAVVGLIISITT